MNKKTLNRRLSLVASIHLKLFLGILLLPLCSMARESTEWVISYAYNANSDQLSRVLLVGDSIVKGYSAKVRDGLAGEAYVSFYATSKGVDDPFYAQELALMLDQYEYQVILFNNGLHSLSSDRTKWAIGLKRAVDMIREKGNGAKLAWVSSTPLKDQDMTEKVQALNTIAAKVMRDNQVPTLDLFELMNPLERELYWSDTYHFKPVAVQMQANEIVDTIRGLLGTEKASADKASEALSAAASKTGPDGEIVTQIMQNGDF